MANVDAWKDVKKALPVAAVSGGLSVGASLFLENEKLGDKKTMREAAMSAGAAWLGMLSKSVEQIQSIQSSLGISGLSNEVLPAVWGGVAYATIAYIMARTTKEIPYHFVRGMGTSLGGYVLGPQLQAMFDDPSKNKGPAAENKSGYKALLD